MSHVTTGITCLERTSTVSESCCFNMLHQLPLPRCSRETVTMVTPGTMARCRSTWQQRPRLVTSHRKSIDGHVMWCHGPDQLQDSDLCRCCLKLWKKEGWGMTSLWMTLHWFLSPVAPPPQNQLMYRHQQPHPLYQVPYWSCLLSPEARLIEVKR